MNLIESDMSVIGLGPHAERRQVADCDQYFNAQFGAKPYYLMPGESGCGDAADEMLVATVGAGVVVAIHDKELQIGGMAYLLMPDRVLDVFPQMHEVPDEVMEAAFKPLEDCISILKQMGAGKSRIRIRIMGGTNYHDDPRESGMKNYIIVKQYMARKGLMAMSEDMNGQYLRRVHFFPATGHAVRWVLRRKNDFDSIHKDEKAYQNAFR